MLHYITYNVQREKGDREKAEREKAREKERRQETEREREVTETRVSKPVVSLVGSRPASFPDLGFFAAIGPQTWSKHLPFELEQHMHREVREPLSQASSTTNAATKGIILLRVNKKC